MPNRPLAHAALVLLAAAGCYEPTLRDCTVICAADDSCPSGLSCGKEGLCELDPTVPCRLILADAGGGKADAPSTPMPDAPSCPGADMGEPDNTCPGESLGPVVEGTQIVLVDRRIFPSGDVDVYTTAIALRPRVCTSHDSVNYALRVALAPPSGTGLRLRRVTSDNRTCALGEATGTSFCQEFQVPCSPTPLAPSILFQVEGIGGASSCSPYELDIRVCAAGSTCDNCKQL